MAITVLAPPEYREMATLYSRYEERFSTQENRTAAMRTLLWQALETRLNGGQLVAMGRQAGIPKPEVIEASFFSSLRPDFKMNTLTGSDGFAYHGIQVFEAELTPSEEVEVIPREETRATPTPNDLAAAWMRRTVTKQGKWKRAATIRLCSAETGVVQRIATEAWNALPDDLKGTRGRRKGQ